MVLIYGHAVDYWYLFPHVEKRKTAYVTSLNTKYTLIPF